MNEFIEHASKSTIFGLKIDVHYLKVDLPSKSIFEQLYNRWISIYFLAVFFYFMIHIHILIHCCHCCAMLVIYFQNQY